jgi:hypothetical protein
VTHLGPEPAQDAAPQASEYVVERPPPGLARGEYGWPPWAIAALGIAAVVLGLVYFAWRLRSMKNR